MGKTYIRILQLKNNFYRDEGRTGEEPLGGYCVLGYFDAFDISKAEETFTTQFNTWESLGKLTADMDGTVNCRMLVCVTEQPDKDRAFWAEQSDILFFVTMVRMTKSDSLSEQLKKIIEKANGNSGQIGYLSYDYSEIIVVTRTNKYSEGIARVNELRKMEGVVKTYTIFAVRDPLLDSYETITKKVEDENVFCRLHCMVKNEVKAETFRKELEKQIGEKNKGKIAVRRFQTLGMNDWLMEINNVSICSILECYKMGNLLTHTNEQYYEAFYNIESEILITGESDGC